ncbi:hypothetical protein AB1283_20370 [Bacillus sp. S13(2024)]|uniref:hypothetical protein n=1 Tax=unclassified Bacillus (in: firmicutes) TaxID=185979 RepID=UPI003D239408
MFMVSKTALKHPEQLKKLIEELTKHGMSPIIELLAVVIVGITFQTKTQLKNNKDTYLVYLCNVLFLLVFLQVVYLFLYLPDEQNVILYMYSVISFVLISTAIWDIYVIIKKTFK